MCNLSRPQASGCIVFYSWTMCKLEPVLNFCVFLYLMFIYNHKSFNLSCLILHMTSQSTVMLCLIWILPDYYTIIASYITSSMKLLQNYTFTVLYCVGLEMSNWTISAIVLRIAIVQYSLHHIDLVNHIVYQLIRIEFAI